MIEDIMNFIVYEDFKNFYYLVIVIINVKIIINAILLSILFNESHFLAVKSILDCEIYAYYPHISGLRIISFMLIFLC